jgi:hypothetical protein
MKFERLESGNFVINGKPITRKAFLMLEPSYSEPVGAIYIRYENSESPYRLIRTEEKQYKISGSWIEGDRYISRMNELSKLSSAIEQQENQEEKEIAETIRRIKSEKVTQTYGDKRKLEYPSIEELVVAMWENLIEKKTKTDSGVSDLQKLRKQVKDKYPSENNDAISKNSEETD